MRYIRHEVFGKSITLYPLVCFHVGAEQADIGFIKEHIKRIAADPQGRWVYLGDGGECVTKASKGDLYRQRLSPDEQIDTLVELLEPVRGQGLFGVSGNHDRRIAKLSGLDWTHALCSRLGIPYLGLAAFLELSIKPGRSTTKHTFETFWHHGVDSSSLLGGKIRSAQKLEQLVRADAIFSAHSHVCMDLPPEYVACISDNGRGARGVRYREVRQFICGCAYDSRVPGYGEEKGYRPILPAHLAATFSVSNNHTKVGEEQKRIEARIWRASA